MTDPTPPPDEPLGDQARARIRAELLAATQTPPTRSRRRVVPAAAAASVALVAGLTAWATGVVGGESGTGDRISPATGTSATPTPSTGPATPSTGPGTPSPSPTEGAPETPAVPQPSAPAPSEAGSGACPVELEHVLKGAERVATFPKDDGGTTSFWVKGDRFSVCDERAGVSTVHKPLPLEPDLDDTATFRVSTLYPPSRDGYRTIRVAGGLVPEGALAFDVAYTFPDGHTENATKVTDAQGRTWWRMVYEHLDDGGNEMQKPPIEVTLSLSGVRTHFTLEWGTDTCAQANHGC